MAPPEPCDLGVARVVHQREIKEQYLKEKQIIVWFNAGRSIISSSAAGCQASPDIPCPLLRSLHWPIPGEGTFWG